MNHEENIRNIRRAQLDQLLSGDAHMAGGGITNVAKIAAKAAEKAAKPALKAVQKVLPLAERDANLAKFLAPSAEKRRMYHGSKEPNIKEFKTRKDLTDESHMTGHYADERDAVFLAPEPEFTKNFSQMGYTDTHQAPTTYPVYVQAENPFDFDNPEHLQRVKDTYLDMYHNPDSEFYDPYLSPSERSTSQHLFKKRVDELPTDENNWPRIENKEFQNVLKDLGFDSFYTRERGTKNLGVYDPNRIKSAIGNRGTYDLSSPDINEAKGGLVHLAGGGTPKKAGGDYTLMGDPSQFAESGESKLYPKTELMNRGVKAIKSGLDSFNRFIDSGPSVRDVLGSVVGAVPFVGPDLRKGMEDSTLTIPYEFQRSETNPKVATGVNTAKVPTTDILDALKMSDITGGTGASNLLGSVGKGYAPNPMDVLDTLGLGVAGYGAAKVAGKGAMKVARAGERFAGKAVPKIMERGGLGAEMLGALGQNTQSRAIKQKGGNWVDSELQRSFGRIKQDESYPQSAIESAKEDLEAVKKEAETWKDLGEQNIMLNTVAQLQRDIDHMEHTNAFNKWVDTKAGSYIRNQMATPDDPVLKMLDARTAKIEADYQAGQQRLAKLDERIAQAPTSTQEERNTLANLQRTRSQRAAEIESDRELAMNSMLPGGKDNAGYDYLINNAADLINTREEAGFPIAGYGQSDAAKAWEAAADFTAQPIPANKLQGQPEKIAALKEASKELYHYQNVELPDKFKAYLDRGSYSENDKQALLRSTPKTMMVDILKDRERSEALANARHNASKEANIPYLSMAEENPYIAKLPPDATVYNAIGLGELGIDHILDVLKDDIATGKLKPEDLSKITMDQAVKRAGEYDFEMAKKSRDAVAQSRATMPVHKEYPEGYKWVQLTKPGEFNAESNAMGHSVRGYEPPRGHPDWTPESGNSGHEYYGHGGWEGIKSGKAKVYSLVDPSGKSHATIEVGPHQGWFTKSDKMPDPSGKYRSFHELIDNEMSELARQKGGFREIGESYEDIANRLANQYQLEANPEITQIKGKGNARPSEKYDQYTQDFVKSGKWADVDDLKNTGLSPISRDYLGHTSSWVPEAEDVKHLTKQQRMEAFAKAIDAGDLPEKGYVTRSELDESLRKHGKPTYAEDTDELLRQLQPPETPDAEPNMAGGGLLSKIGKAAKAARAAEELVPAAGRMKFADQPRGGLNIVKEAGGNWLGGSVEGALKPLKGPTESRYTHINDQGMAVAEGYGRPMTANELQSRNADPVYARNKAVNKWVDSNLTNYVKKQMATPEDPVRKLSEEGITHFPIAEDPMYWSIKGESSRKEAGGNLMSKSDLAQQWENRSDAVIQPVSVRTIKKVKDSNGPGAHMYESWMDKVDPNTKLHMAGSNFDARDLGFDHIVDVLKEDLAAGRIRPEQLSKVSMEQAVRRTYEYDQEMAKKMREAAIKQTEGMPVHKEYPEGYKWVELSVPQNKVLPEGYSIVKNKGVDLDSDDAYLLKDATGKVIGFGGSEAEIVRGLSNTNTSEGYKKLKEALDYEGSTMGHCVGSYCDEVSGGNTKIYSLRDKKGEPHVTIEVNKGYDAPSFYETNKNLLEDPRFKEAQEMWNDYADTPEQYVSELTKLFKDAGLKEGKDYTIPIETKPRIKQIKGKQNRAPKDEYLPYVQDFVKSSDWDEVGDLRNTGLKTIDEAFPNYEDAKRYGKSNSNIKYLTQAEIDAYNKEVNEELLNEFGRHRIKPDPESRHTLGRTDFMTVRELAELEFPNDLQRQANMIRGSLQGATEPGAYSGVIHPPLDENGMAGGGSIGLRNALNNLLRTDKPEVHMALGGKVVAKAAKAAEAAGKAATKLDLVEKVPKGVEPIIVRSPEEKSVIEKFGQKQEQEAVRQKKVEKAAKESAGKSPEDSVKPTKSTGKRVAVPPDIYRKMAETQGDEAVLRAARAGKHLKPTGEGYIGAPRTVTSPQGLGAMRRDMDTDFADSVEAVRLADPDRLGTWYDRAKQGIAESVEPYQLPRTLEQHGVYSAGVSPESELTFALKHLNSRVAGKPEMAYRGAGMRNLDTAVAQQRPAKMGFKIGEYAEKNDPRVPNAGLFGVNDFRRAQGMGYTDPQGNPWKAGVSDTMHPFMDAETALQVDRANTAGTGGRTDWAGPHIQEVPWVYGKGQDLYSRGKGGRYSGDELEGIKQSLVDANNTARDYMYKHAASATHEQIPGASLGHVRQALDMTPEQKLAYGREGRFDIPSPEAALNEFPEVGAGNRDAIYSALGYRQLPSREAEGLYINSLGGVETNPMTIARPLMDFPTGGGGGRMADESSKMMDTAEQFRALMDAQEAGAYNLPNTMDSVKGKNAMVLDTRSMNPNRLADPSAGVLPTAEQLSQINKSLGEASGKAEKNAEKLREKMPYGPPTKSFARKLQGLDEAAGGYGVTATNRGALIFPYNSESGAGGLNEIMRNAGSGLEEAFPGAQRQKAIASTGYVPGVGKRSPEGPLSTAPYSGEATSDMLQAFAEMHPTVAQNLSESEAVRAAIRAKALRDSKMGGARGDIQETRRFFSEADWPKAVAMMRKGISPAAALAALGYNINAMAADER